MKTNEELNYTANHGTRQAALGKQISSVKEVFASFEFNRSDGAIAILAYSTPSRKIGTAVGLPGLCHPKSFHLNGNDIVCDIFSTRWDLVTLQGSSGECPACPLELPTHTVHDGRLIIREGDLKNWKPRIARSYKHATA